MKNSILIYLFLCIVVSQLSAQTYINRESDGQGGYNIGTQFITDHQVWTAAGNPYIAEGYDNLYIIEKGGSLTIEAGVEVRFPNSRDGSGIMVRGGDLQVLGTAENPVLFYASESYDSPNATWSGIRFIDSATGTIQHAKISRSGHISRGWQAFHPASAIYADNSSINVNNVIIDSSEANGFRLKNCFNCTVHSNLVRKSGADPVSGIDHNSPYRIESLKKGLNFHSNNSANSIINATFIKNSTIEDTVSLDKNNIPYFVEGYDGHLTIAEKGSLTLQAGVTIKFSESRDGSAIINKGELILAGSQSDSILMTSVNDTTKGAVDSAYKNPSPGDWSGIRFEGNAKGAFSNTIIRYAGHLSVGFQAYHPNATLDLKSGMLTADHLTIEYSQGIGVLFNNASATINNCTLKENLGYFAGSSVNDSFSKIPVFKNCSISNNGYNGLRLSGAINEDITLSNTSFPYIISQYAPTNTGLVIPKEKNLIIKPEVTILFNTTSDEKEQKNIFVNGNLDVQGSASGKVLFTSLYDTTTPFKQVYKNEPANLEASLYWGSIVFSDSSESGSFKHSIFRYGGMADSKTEKYGLGMLQIQGGTVTVDSIEISNESLQKDPFVGTGIFLSGGNLKVTNTSFSHLENGLIVTDSLPDSKVAFSEFYDISNNAVENTNDKFSFVASYNWWGDKSGPSGIGQGTGASVNGLVTIAPWYKDQDDKGTIFHVDSLIPKDTTIKFESSFALTLSEKLFYDISNSNLSIKVEGLPKSFSYKDGKISSIKAESGEFNATIIAENEYGQSDSVSFKITVAKSSNLENPEVLVDVCSTKACYLNLFNVYGKQVIHSLIIHSTTELENLNIPNGQYIGVVESVETNSTFHFQILK